MSFATPTPRTRPSSFNQINGETKREGPSKAEADPSGENVPHIHEIWNIEDSLKYAPPRPDGDPWDILLDRLMKKDKMRCDAWRDEVQNLLIFAGLFSAVVTAFIIESYKSLQPDPNDSVMNLLAHIATRLDGPLDSNLTFTSPKVQLFSPTSSSVRVNSFWFISLVLSLTTVLVGIIALQWLREHQSYSTDLSTREKYALYFMRADGLKTWQVDKIFNSLPLLLQCALILFLGGVIDFLQAIGNLGVLVPVIAIVGLTLIFLVMTTILPCLQVSLLYSSLFLHQDLSGNAPDKIPPSQCPYKSPQSHAIRNLWLSILGIYSNVRYKIRFQYGIWRFFPRFSTLRVNHEDDTTKSHFTRYLYAASFESNWTCFDLAWLAIRDGYMRFFYKRSSSAEYIARTDIVPIFDIVLGLLDQAYHTSLFPSTYHCLAEISDLAMQPPHTAGFASIEDLFRQSAYLHDLIATKEDIPLPDYLTNSSQSPPGPLSRPDVSTNAPYLSLLFKHQQIMESFIPYHFSRKTFALPSIHRMELRLRLLRSFFSAKKINFSPGLGVKIPECLVLHHYHALAIVDHEQEDAEVFAAFAWQFAHLTRVILEQTNKPSLRPESAAHHPTIQHYIIVPFMETSGYYAERLLRFRSALNTVNNGYHSVFDFIEENLRKEMASWTETNVHPSLFFYTSSLFAYNACLDWSSENTDQTTTDIPFRAMCTAVCVYREQTIATGIFDPDIEKQLTKDADTYTGRLHDADSPRTFSSEWWMKLDVYKSADSTLLHSSHTSSVGSN